MIRRCNNGHSLRRRSSRGSIAWPPSSGRNSLTDAGRQIAAVVVDARGEIVGCQTKNQLDPTEEAHYVPGDTRQLFEVDGVKFGVAICHEGFRYPETVRWAAVRGAKIVFHPHCTGSDKTGVRPSQWGSSASPYYEKAMMCRALENTIYFASVNYAFRYPESATCIIGPAGECLAHLPYGEEGVLVREIDLAAASGLLAARSRRSGIGKRHQAYELEHGIRDVTDRDSPPSRRAEPGGGAAVLYRGARVQHRVAAREHGGDSPRWGRVQSHREHGEGVGGERQLQHRRG